MGGSIAERDIPELLAEVMHRLDEAEAQRRKEWKEHLAEVNRIEAQYTEEHRRTAERIEALEREAAELQEANRKLRREGSRLKRKADADRHHSFPVPD